MTAQVRAIAQSIGGLAFPIVADDFTDSLAPLDATRDRLLQLFQTAINAELGEVWRKIVDTSLDPGSKFSGTQPVDDILPLRPSLATMQARKCSFPLLALHRDGDVEYEEFLLDEIREKQSWMLHYIVGPGDIEVERKLLDIVYAVARVVALVIRQRGHKDYDGGALQFFPGVGSLASVRLVKRSALGQAVFSEDPSVMYWAIQMTIETTEISSDNLDAIADFDAADFNFGLTDETGTLPDFVQGSTDAIVSGG